LAEVSDALRTTDPRTAQLLGVASWNIAELPETRRALLGALAQPQTDTFTDPAPGIRPSRFLVDSGHTLLSADGVGWRTWDVTAHRRTASGRLPDGMVMEAGPDGRRLAIVRDDAVRMWDTLTGRWTGPALPGDTVVNFGPDGRSYVESSLYDDRVRLRSAADGTPLFETRVAGLSVVEPSIGGRMMAVCSPGRLPQVWDTAAHRIRRGAWESAGSRCDDQSLLVFGGSGRPDRFAMVFDNGVRIWDTTSGRQIASLDDAGVNSVSFSADGAFLATADGDEIKVWRLASFMDNAPAPVFRHPLNNERIYGDLAWDSGRPRLRYLEGGTVHTLDLADAVTAPWRDDPLDAVVLSPDGRTLATAERIGDTRLRVRLRDPRDGRLLRTLPPVPWPVSLDPDEPVVVADTLALMAFSSDGGTLAYGLSAPGRRAAPQKVVLWDVARGRARTTLDLATPSSAGAVVAIALGPSGHHLYAMRTPHIGELRNEVWDTERHRRTAEYDEATEPEMAIRPDGRLLVTSDHTVSWPSGAVRAHNLVQGNEIGALAFAPDGSQLAAGDMSGRVTLWDSSLKHREGVLRNAFPAPLDGTAEGVSALAVSPDGRTLAVGGDAGTLQLWDIATRQPLGGPLTTADDTIASVSFSPDSTTVYAAGPHVLLTRYTIDPAQAVTRICARNGNVGLTSAQWKTYVPDAPYRTVCGR
jgi:WD40 repeat protein